MTIVELVRVRAAHARCRNGRLVMNLVHKLPLICVALAAALVVGVEPSPAVQELSPQKTREELLKLHNQERKKEDLSPLRLNPDLTRAAQEYAEFLARSGEFGHKIKGTPRSRVKDAGYKPKAVGENIAIGQPTPSLVFKDWLESKVHQENILREDFSEVGFGFATDKEGQMIWVTDFGDQ
jgi:uncharacterized protein YkwD